MRRVYIAPAAAGATLALQSIAMGQSPAESRPLRIIAFGAHPDDAELKASGVAALWAAQGHKVKFVAMTNGDLGHFAQAGGPLAKRRKAEVGECAKILGIENEVLAIVKRRSAAVVDQYRERLVALYGQERADKVKYAEAFQLGQYGRQASVDELKQMFPRVQ